MRVVRGTKLGIFADKERGATAQVGDCSFGAGNGIMSSAFLVVEDG